MKTHLKSLLNIGIVLLLITAVTACKKNTQEDPAPEVKTNLTGTIDGKALTLDQSALKSTYYATDGDGVKALSTTATINAAGDKMDFFIADLKNGTTTLSKKLGTSANPGNPNLRVNDVGTTATTTQSYVKYVSGGNTYYAYAGTFEVVFTSTSITVKWSISFKDASGREFTSTGSFVFLNYAAVTQPKAAIVDPTPVALKPTIESIALTQGMSGDTISVSGVNYSTTATENVFKFNGVSATVVSATATKLRVLVPQQGTTGAVSLQVKNSDVVTGPTYTFLLPATITSFAPLSAKVGDTVTITGTNFATTPADNAVKFAGTAGTVIAATATQLKVTVAANAVTGAISLSVKGRATINTSEFIVNPTLQGNSLGWVDLGFTGVIGDENQTATVGTKTMFTGGLFPTYLYLTTNGVGFTDVYANLPFTKTGLQLRTLTAGATAFFITTTTGVAKSTDGSTWTKLTPDPNLPDLGFTGIVVSGETVTLINAGKLYVSTNGGTSFTISTVTAPAGASIDYIISDINGKYFYGVDLAKNLVNTDAKIFYRPTNQGQTWLAATSPAGYYFYGNGGYPDFLKGNSGGTF
ncbi:MAG: IPT/TIG domain-containing protein, partial [Mucilaginibacter sp.]|nr:IPT/TIG domain-containing protein [Mucilaginibacter sp.]